MAKRKGKLEIPTTFVFPMLYLVLSACLSVTLFVIFRLYPRYQVQSREAIYINYWVCTLVGLAFSPHNAVALVTPQSWWLEAGAIGTLFVFTFVVMSRSVQEAGITVSTVSTKISMVIPVLVNLFLLHTETELSTAGWIGLGLALPSIVLCSIPASGSDQAHGMVKKVKTWAYILLPLQLFLQAGIADTLINVANQIKLTAEDQAPFTIVVFAVCALWGGVFLLVNLLKGNQITKATLLGGIALGIPNFFSLYFLVKGLESFGNNGAIAFPIINLLTILIAAFVALLVFRDKFSGLNWLGLLMALAGIMLLAGWYNNLLNLFR